LVVASFEILPVDSDNLRRVTVHLRIRSFQFTSSSDELLAASNRKSPAEVINEAFKILKQALV
jgi:hypothetical protein